MIEPLSADDFEARALGADTPTALDFYQESCPPCHALTPRLERVARAFSGRVPVYRIDIDRDMPLAERFGVMSLPTVLILKGGREGERLDGLIREADLRRAFKEALR